MAEDPIWYLVVTVIIGGGGAASLVTYLFDKLAKRREEAVDMAKFRMDRIEKKYTDYMDLTRYTNEVFYYSTNFSIGSQVNNIKLLRSTLKFCETFERILDKGNFLLGDQDAESILSELSHSLMNRVETIFSNDENYWKFRGLNSMKGESNFFTEIQNQSTDYYLVCDVFCKWFDEPKNKSSKTDIEMICNCIVDLLVFEINTVFQQWYNHKFNSAEHIEKQSIDFLRSRYTFYGKKSLAEAYPRYYRKIYS